MAFQYVCRNEIIILNFKTVHLSLFLSLSLYLSISLSISITLSFYLSQCLCVCIYVCSFCYLYLSVSVIRQFIFSLSLSQILIHFIFIMLSSWGQLCTSTLTAWLAWDASHKTCQIKIPKFKNSAKLGSSGNAHQKCK